MENNIENKNNIKIIIYIISALISLSIIFITVKCNRELTHFDIKHLKHFILGYGNFAALCFVITYSLKPILFFVPTSILTIIAGSIFGPFTGLCLSMLGLFFSSTLAFYLARFLGKSFVDKTLGKKALRIDENIGKNGFIIIFLMRLSIVFPFDPLGYACGLSKMRYRDFILGTLLGAFPEMVMCSFMGNNICNPLSIRFILPIILVLLLAIASYFVYKNSKKTV